MKIEAQQIWIMAADKQTCEFKITIGNNAQQLEWPSSEYHPELTQGENSSSQNLMAFIPGQTSSILLSLCR